MKRSLSNCHLTHGCFSTVSDKSGLFSSTKLNDFPSNIPWDSSMPISTSTANQSEITKLKVNSAVKRFQKHDGDTGSAAVQSKFIPYIFPFSRLTIYNFSVNLELNSCCDD